MQEPTQEKYQLMNATPLDTRDHAREMLALTMPTPPTRMPNRKERRETQRVRKQRK